MTWTEFACRQPALAAAGRAQVMKIGAALVLLAVGAILRYAIFTTATHGVDLRTVGDILMIVGALMTVTGATEAPHQGCGDSTVSQ